FAPADPYARRDPGTAAAIPASFRFGLPKPEQQIFMGDAQSEAMFKSAVERVKAMGGTPVEVDIAPFLAAAQLLYSGPWVAERTAAVEELVKTTPGAINPTVRAILQGGLAYSAVDTFKAMYEMQAYARVAEQMWEGADVL